MSACLRMTDMELLGRRVGGIGDLDRVWGGGGFGERKLDYNDGTGAAGLNFQRPAKLSKTLSHASNANTGRTGGGHFLLLLGGDAFAFVFDLDAHMIVTLAKANPGDRTFRMTVNIGKAFLHDAENGGFGLTRQAPEILGEIQSNLDFAAQNKSVDIPAKGGGQAGFIQQRGMKQV